MRHLVNRLFKTDILGDSDCGRFKQAY